MKWLLFLGSFLFFSNSSFAKELNLVSVKQYSKLSQIKKSAYIKNLQIAWSQFESKYPHPLKKGFSFEQIFWERAFAGEEGKCIIGGVLLDTVNGYCSTRTRPSCGGSDGFLCGDIYGKSCVTREPVETLSKRCYESGKEFTPDAAQFEIIVSEMRKDYQALCLEKVASNTADGCLFLTKRITELGKDKEFGVDPDAEERLVTAATLRTAGRSDERAPKQKINKVKGDACPNDYDPVTKVTFKVSLFNLENDTTCAFARNKKLLNQVAQTGCETYSPQPRDELTKTMFHPPQDSTCIYGQTCFDAIIEDVVVEDGVTEMQVLKPKINQVPPTLVRETLRLKKVGKNYQLINPDGTTGPSFEIENTVRTDLITKYRSTTNQLDSSLQLINDVRMMFADNCRLSKVLNEQHLYQTTIPQPSSSSTSK